MTDKEEWIDIGSTEEVASIPLKSCKAGTTALAISFKDGQFGAVSNICNHVGGPLGDGRLDGDYIICPWHGWKFHRRTGVGEPGKAPAYSSTSRRRRGVSKHRIDLIHSRASLNVRQGHCVLSASRRP